MQLGAKFDLCRGNALWLEDEGFFRWGNALQMKTHGLWLEVGGFAYEDYHLASIGDRGDEN